VPDEQAEETWEAEFAELQSQLESAQARVRSGVGSTGDDHELRNAYEELRVASEELRVQQDHIDQLRQGQLGLRRQHERMLTALPVPALTTGAHGIIRWANAGAAMLGDARVNRLVGKPVLTLFSVETRHELRHVISDDHTDGASFRIRAVLEHGGSVEVAVAASSVPGLEPRLTWMVFGEGHVPAEAFSSGDLPGVLATLATLPADTEDPVELLDAAAELTRDVLGPEVALTVTYGSPEDPTILSSTDAVAQQIDGLQLRIGEGPCVDAFTSGHTVVTDLARTDPRWPALAEAIPKSVGAIVSVPLRAAGTLVGALNIYCSSPGSDPARVLTAEVLASTIGAILHEQALKAELHGAAEDLQKAMSSRAVIDQAKGIVMAERGCGADEAFAHLGRLSSQRGVKVREVAADLVARRTGSA